MNEQNKVYDVVSKMPVARFFYQGTHSHPVRRTVVIIKNLKNSIVGYEFREGAKVRAPEEAVKHVKTYRLDRIAKYGDYVRLRETRRGLFKKEGETTLERLPLVALFRDGA